MSLFHPRADRLRRWLDGADDPTVDDHVATCDRCANRMDDMEPAGPALRDLLFQSLATPDDLGDRIRDRMQTSLQNRADLALALDLMGVSFQTIRSVLTEEET